MIRTPDGGLISLRDWALSFKSERDIKKCLLYGWVWNLLSTDSDHWLNHDAISKKSMRLRQEALGIDPDEYYNEIQRWKFRIGEQSILKRVPYENVSRNDLLFFASTADLRGEAVFTAMLNLDLSSLPTFWRVLKTEDVFGFMGFPQLIPIHDKANSSRLRADFTLADRPNDIRTYYNRATFPLFGTKTLSRRVQLVQNFSSFEDFNSEGVVLASEVDYFNFITSPGFATHIREYMNRQINENTDQICGGIDFFRVFDVTLYVVPHSDIRLGMFHHNMGFLLLGIVNIQPGDISPVGIDYWSH
jgi:hypothetical protein